MKIKFLQSFILCTIFTLTHWQAQAQIDQFEVSVSHQSENVTVCEDQTTSTFRIEANQTGITDVVFTVNLPEGLSMVELSSTIVSENPAGYVLDADESDPENPVFTITSPNADELWLDGEFIEFSLLREAACDAIAADIGGTTFKDEYTIDFTLGGTPSSYTDDTTNGSYNVLYPALSILNVNNVSGAAVGDIITEDLRVFQGGSGCTSTYTHFVVLGDEIGNYELSYEGNSLLPTTVSADTLFYEIDFTTAPFDTVGNGDGCFDNNEFIDLDESFQILGCDNLLIKHHAQFGCNDEFCTDAGATPAIRNIAIVSGIPVITLTNVTNTRAELCEVVTMTVLISNTRTRPSDFARDLDVIFGLGANSTAISSPDAQTLWGSDYRGTRFWENFMVDGEPVSIMELDNPTFPTRGDASYLDFSTLADDPGGPGVGLDDADGDGFFDDLPAGQSITVTFDYRIEPRDGICGVGTANFLQWEHLYFDVSFDNQCGEPRPPRRVDLGYSNIIRDRFEATRTSGPSDIVDQQIFDVCIRPVFGFEGTRQDCNGENAQTSSSATWLTKLQLPPGISYVGTDPGYTQVGDEVIFETEMFDRNEWEEHCFTVQLDCAAWDGSRPISFPFETTYQCKDDAGDVCFELDVHCQSIDIFPHCPGPCTGPATQTFTAERQTEGWTDDTRTTQVSDIVSGVNHFLPFDTIKVTSDMLLSDTTIVDLLFRLSNAPQNEGSDGSLLEFIEADFTVTPSGGSPGTPMTLAAPTISTGKWGNELTFDLAAGGPYNAGDYAVVCAYFVVSEDFADNNYYEIETFRGEFYTFDENDGSEVICDSWGQRAYYEDIRITHSTVSDTFSGCESGELDSFVQFDGSIEDPYPDEYRPFYKFNRLAIYIDPTLTWLGTFSWTDTKNTEADILAEQIGDSIIFTPGPTYSEVDHDLNRFVQRVKADVVGTCETNLNTPVPADVYLTKYWYHPDASVHETRNIKATERNVRYQKPTFLLQGVPASIQGNTAEAFWDVELCNTTTALDVPFNYLLIEDNPNIQVTQIVEVDGGTETPLTTSMVGDMTYVEAEELNRTDCKVVRIYFTYSDCGPQTLNVKSGWNCAAYPDDIDLPAQCFEETVLTVTPQNALVQLNITEQPSAVTLCEDFSITANINSGQTADLVDPLLALDLPTDFTPSMVEVEYFAGSGNWETISTTVVNDSLYMDLTQHSNVMNNSINGVATADPAEAGADRSMNIRVTGQVGCEFRSGSRFAFNVFGDKPCGDPATGDGVRRTTNRIFISGAEETYTAASSMTAGDLTCFDETAVTMNLLIDNGTIGDNDFVLVQLPAGVTYESCTGCPGTPSQSGQEIKIPLTPGSTGEITFDLNVSRDDATCGELEITYDVLAEFSNLTCGNDPCDVIQREVDTGSAPLPVDLPDFAFVNPRIFTNAPGYVVRVDVTNNGSPIPAGESAFIDVYCADGVGDAAAVVTTIEVPGPWAMGETKEINENIGENPGCDDALGFVFAMNEDTENQNSQCLCTELSALITDLILPVKLTSFDAETDGCASELAWSTASEINSLQFEIERSTDGISFETVGIVPASGNTNTPRDYTYSDVTDGGAFYYRLKMVDSDFTFEYSPIEFVFSACNTRAITVYPNPVVDLLTVEVPNVNVSSIQVFSGIGEVHNLLITKPGEFTHQIDVNQLSSGLYVLRIESETDEILFAKFVKR